MLEQYNNLDISFQEDNIRFRTLNIAFETLQRIIPSHSHGEDSYEIHYVSSGEGIVGVRQKACRITPGTLYVVGPHVPHSQISMPGSPMEDYCIYLRMEKTAPPPRHSGGIAALFIEKNFWIGPGSDRVREILESIFEELRRQPIGYTSCVETLLRQLMIHAVRCYHRRAGARLHFQPATLADAQDFILEESFLYDYPTLTLEQLADRLGLSVRQTQRLLQERHGQTFLQKRSSARISSGSGRSSLSISGRMASIFSRKLISISFHLSTCSSDRESSSMSSSVNIEAPGPLCSGLLSWRVVLPTDSFPQDKTLLNGDNNNTEIIPAIINFFFISFSPFIFSR